MVLRYTQKGVARTYYSADDADACRINVLLRAEIVNAGFHIEVAAIHLRHPCWALQSELKPITFVAALTSTSEINIEDHKPVLDKQLRQGVVHVSVGNGAMDENNSR